MEAFLVLIPLTCLCISQFQLYPAQPQPPPLFFSVKSSGYSYIQIGNETAYVSKVLWWSWGWQMPDPWAAQNLLGAAGNIDRCIIFDRVVTKISSCQVNTTSTQGIKQLARGFFWFYFPLKVARGNPRTLPLNDTEPCLVSCPSRKNATFSSLL